MLKAGHVDFFVIWVVISQKVNRKVQGMPQSEAAANHWHPKEERKVVQNKQMHEKHIDQLSLPQARWSQY